MILLKQPLITGDDGLNEFAADILRGIRNVQEVRDYYFNKNWDEGSLTTIGLFMKCMLRQFLNGGDIPCNLSQTVDSVNNIAELSGRGGDKYQFGDGNSHMVCLWSWAFVSALKSVAERNENMETAVRLWQRYSDGSAHMATSDRWLVLEAPDIHDDWSRSDCGVIEKWYDKADEDYHYFNYKIFPSEYEARIFIAELVMKINTPWTEPLRLVRDDLTDAIAEVYSTDERRIGDELISRQKEDGGGIFKQHVYIMRFSDGVIKVGIATNIVRRVRQKEKDSGRKCVEVCATELFKSADAYRIEALCKAELKKYCIAGEFFDCTYEHAQVVLSGYAPITHRLKF